MDSSNKHNLSLVISPRAVIAAAQRGRLGSLVRADTPDIEMKFIGTIRKDAFVKLVSEKLAWTT